MVFSAAMGAIGASGIGALGNVTSALMSAKQAKKQRKFQERMSNTQYQRGMKDMRAAGLNPILAYKQGGASSPSGAMGQVPDMGKIGDQALKGYAAKQQLQLLTEQTRAARTAADVNVNTARNLTTKNQLDTWKIPEAEARGRVWREAIKYGVPAFEFLEKSAGGLWNSGGSSALDTFSTQQRKLRKFGGPR